MATPDNIPVYQALVIGLGQIGQGYDYYLDNNLVITTHSSAYTQHPQFELVGGVDTNADCRRLFEDKYNLPTYKDVATAIQAEKPVVVSIATPTDCHLDSFRALLSIVPRAVVLEKPIAGNILEARELVQLAHDHDIALLVNYVRRYEPGTKALRKMLSDSLIGKIYKGVVYYCKGIKNGGSHYVDLLAYLLGPPTLSTIISRGRSFAISGVDDYEPDFVVEFSGIPVSFLSINHEYFMHSEVKLFGESGVVTYGGGEIKYQLAVQDPVFSSYQTLDKSFTSIDSDFDRYQYHVITALGDVLLEGKERDYFHGQEALDILEIFEEFHD